MERSRQVSYQALRDRVRAVAGFVSERHAAGTGPGGRPIVLVIGESSIEQVIAYLGVLYAGAIPAPIAEPSSEVVRAIALETGAQLALVATGAGARLGDSVASVVTFEDAVGPPLAEPIAVPVREMAALMYTSGSTGRPRGVMVSTHNLWANTCAILDMLPLAEDDCALVALPLYYCYGASVIHTHLRVGATVALTTDTFPDELVTALLDTGASGLPSVPSMIQMLLTRSRLAAVRPPRVRYVMISGGRLPDQAVHDLRAALPAAQIYVRYGVTELTAAVSYLPPDRMHDKLGSIGRGLPGAPLHVEHDDGTAVEPGSGAVGEIVVRGDHVTLGYFSDEEEPTRAFRDGAFHTGDLATIDHDGFVFIVGRAKEFVKTGGHRVAPQEVENVLVQLRGVESAGVCGVAHPIRGEALVAAVVVVSGSPISERELRRHCAERLPPHKVPTRFRILAALPRTSNGKLDRRALAAAMASP